MDQSSPINHVCDTSMDDVYAKEAHNTAGFWIGFIPPLEFIKMYIPSSCALKVTPSKEVRGRIVIKSCCQEGYQHNSQARVAFMQKCGGKISASVIRSYMELKDGCPKTAVESHPLQEVDDTREDAQVQDDGEHIQTSASGEVAIPLPPGSERIPTRTDLDPGLFVEIATHGDPFHDDPKDAQQWGTIEKREYQSMLTRGKLAWQAKQTFNRQHRTHVFQLLVFGDEARFVRWDRAGASVSGKFNYVEHPSQVRMFFYLYGCMSDAERGWDASVGLASSQEESIFVKVLTYWSRSMFPIDPQAAMDANVSLDPSWPTYKVAIGSTQIRHMEDVLIFKKPFHNFQGRTVGCGTRKYMAYSTKWRGVILFKDEWRCNDGIRYAESTAYYYMGALGASSHVSRMILGGDVARNVTRTNELVRRSILPSQSSTWLVTCGNAVEAHPWHQHRIVQNLSHSLKSLPSTKEVVYVVRDCFHAVLEAFKMGLLHRSIGYSSVRARYYGVLGRWIGILSDWNACAHINAPYSKIRDRIERWEFLSIEHLEDPSKTHDIMDDLQTLFWVLLWTVIHHFDSSSSATSFNPEIFSEKHSVLIDGKSQDIGGRMKRQFLVKGHEILDLVEPIQSASLMWLLTKMSTHWGQYYRLKAKLAGVEIRGVQNALCLAKTRAGPSLPASEEQVSAAREFAGKYVEVSDPEFWIGMCTEAIAMDMWVMDAMPLGLLAGAYSGGVRSSYDAAADDVVPVNGSEEAHPGTFTVEFDAGEADKESAGAPKSVHCDERPISKDPRNESEENLEQNEHRPDKRSREEGDFNDENNTNDSGMRRKRVRQSGQSEEGEHSKTLPPLPRECKGHAQLVRTDSEQLVADVIHKLKVRPHESALKRGAAEDVASGMVDGAAGDQSSSALKGCIGATAIELEESAVSRGE